MGSGNPRKAKGEHGGIDAPPAWIYSEILSTQTAWEGGLYKLVMTFPEGPLSPLLILLANMLLLIDYPAKPPKCHFLSSDCFPRRLLTWFIQANLLLLCSIPTCTPQALYACQSWTKRSHGNLQLQSSRCVVAIMGLHSLCNYITRSYSEYRIYSTIQMWMTPPKAMLIRCSSEFFFC